MVSDQPLMLGARFECWFRYDHAESGATHSTPREVKMFDWVGEKATSTTFSGCSGRQQFWRTPKKYVTRPWCLWRRIEHVPCTLLIEHEAGIAAGVTVRFRCLVSWGRNAKRERKPSQYIYFLRNSHRRALKADLTSFLSSYFHILQIIQSRWNSTVVRVSSSY